MNSGTLTVDAWAIDRVIPYARNPRDNAGAVAKVAAAIQEFGWRQPIVVDTEGVIVVGHTRLLAARQLRHTHVPVHVAEGLSPAQVKAYRLADNRVHEESSWDEGLLALELQDLEGLGFALDLTGFDQTELGRLLHLAADPIEISDDAPDLPAEPITRPGDLIALGEHRLLCGDAGEVAAVARLLAGDAPGVLWTDPPYGVQYTGKTKRALTIANDTRQAIAPLLEAAFGAITPHLARGARAYIAAPAGAEGTTFRLAFTAAGWHLHQVLVWVKDSFVLGHSDYHYRHEDLLYGWKPGAGRVGRGNHEGSRWYGDHTQATVLEYPRPTSSTLHPTMKPLGLVEACLRNSARRGDVVADVFAGAGATLLACERLGLCCRAMELAPDYCDVIVQRWEEATGGSATRERLRDG